MTMINLKKLSVLKMTGSFFSGQFRLSEKTDLSAQISCFLLQIVWRRLLFLGCQVVLDILVHVQFANPNILPFGEQDYLFLVHLPAY